MGLQGDDCKTPRKIEILALLSAGLDLRVVSRWA